MLGLRCYKRASFSCSKWGLLSSCGRRASRCTGFSCCRAQVLGIQASAVVAHGLSGSGACGIFLDQGSNSCPLHWQVDSYPLNHQGSPIGFVFFFLCCISLAMAQLWLWFWLHLGNLKGCWKLLANLSFSKPQLGPLYWQEPQRHPLICYNSFFDLILESPAGLTREVTTYNNDTTMAFRNKPQSAS